MHIPDGYLSPATCAATFVAAAPFWHVALRKVERRLHTRTIPLLAVFSAFSFVVMMFNLPLPGGTTGHAVGLGIAAAVLGPWAGMLAISLALTIQAFFFGDGGISTLGANCFNMGVVGVGGAWLVYRIVAGNAAADAPRRALAAGVAGYAGINFAALVTAVEFGVQPLWFHTEAGLPLYAPYPLEVAIPAMMIGHLGLAGIAEAAVSGGLVAWLQKAQPELLAPAAAEASGEGGWRGVRRLLGLVGALMVLAPLGQLAAGTAWGEWSGEHFANGELRAEVAAASLGRELPAAVPAGLERLSSLWASPIPDYEMPFLPASLGYAISAMLGGGLILLASLAAGRILARRAARD